jgi:proteasome lid subunit RPN8/RPN11
MTNRIIYFISLIVAFVLLVTVYSLIRFVQEEKIVETYRYISPEADLVLEFHPTDNDAKSARVYTLNPKQHLLIERDAEDRGLEVIGVVHSHTHTEAYPSPTDVAQAPDPTWHYMIVTVKRGVPEPRSFRIINGEISETEISVY